MGDYGGIYADWRIHVLYSLYQRFGDDIVAKASAVLDTPGNVSDLGNGTVPDSAGDPVGETPRVPANLPSGFRRLADLRKRAQKVSYDDLKGWVGKTIRLDNVKIDTSVKDDKTVLTGGTMTFSEFDPANPDRETEDTTTTAIPRSALRALYEGLSKNPDETIVCDVTMGKRGLSLQ